MDLSDILKGALGEGSSAAPAAPAGGQSDLIAKLLPLVLQMLQGGGRGAAAGVGPGGGGGMQDALGGLGGLGGLVSAFTQNGLGDVIGSWIGRGQNQPVSSDQLAQVLGPNALAQLSAGTGASHGDVSSALSQLLPQVVDRLTPDGSIPDQGVEGVAGDLFAKLGLPTG